MNLSNITYNTTDEPDTMDPNVNGTIATAFRDFLLNTTSALLLGEEILPFGHTTSAVPASQLHVSKWMLPVEIILLIWSIR